MIGRVEFLRVPWGEPPMLTRQSVIGLTSAVASSLVLALAFGTATAASLKDKPPSGIKLSGTWKLDSERSDDPREVLDRAAKTAREKQEDARIARSDRGGVFGDDDPLGRYDRGPYGDPRSGPMDRGRGPYDRRLPGDYPDDPRRTTDGTVLRRDRDRGSTTVDPTSGDVSASWGTGAQSINNVWLLQLDPSPDTLTVIDNGTHVSVSENKLETECKAGEKAPIADSFGDGQRQCGWNGKAWVIETKRDKRFTRTDRFELGKNGAILTYVTSASGSNMPSIRIFRTYTLVPATAAP
jgi:hypothetical protein